MTSTCLFMVKGMFTYDQSHTSITGEILIGLYTYIVL